MQRLIWSPLSVDDLVGIDLFLTQQNPQAAARMLRLIGSAANRLLDYPLLGRAVRDPYRVIGVRTTPYLLVYRLQPSGVETVRVRHGREDWLGPIEAEL